MDPPLDTVFEVENIEVDQQAYAPGSPRRRIRVSLVQGR
jgi:hypothetical protein